MQCVSNPTTSTAVQFRSIPDAALCSALTRILGCSVLDGRCEQLASVYTEQLELDGHQTQQHWELCRFFQNKTPCANFHYKNSQKENNFITYDICIHAKENEKIWAGQVSWRTDKISFAATTWQRHARSNPFAKHQTKRTIKAKYIFLQHFHHHIVILSSVGHYEHVVKRLESLHRERSMTVGSVGPAPTKHNCKPKPTGGCFPFLHIYYSDCTVSFLFSHLCNHWGPARSTWEPAQGLLSGKLWEEWHMAEPEKDPALQRVHPL